MSDTTRENGAKASEIHALANVFISILSQLNDAAAKQSMSILEMASLAAKVAQSLASSATDINPRAAEEVIAPVVEQFNKASQQYKEISQKAHADLQAYTASLKPGDANGEADLADQVYDNLLAGINLMIQNAVANQQAVNELGSAALAQGIVLIYSLAANRKEFPAVESAKPS